LLKHLPNLVTLVGKAIRAKNSPGKNPDGIFVLIEERKKCSEMKWIKKLMEKGHRLT